LKIHKEKKEGDKDTDWVCGTNIKGEGKHTKLPLMGMLRSVSKGTPTREKKKISKKKKTEVVLLVHGGR